MKLHEYKDKLLEKCLSPQVLIPGSVLILFTDGILERENITGEEFGEQRLKDVIINNKTQSSDVLLSEIFTAANDFGHKKKWKDDATVVIVKRISIMATVMVAVFNQLRDQNPLRL